MKNRESNEENGIQLLVQIEDFMEGRMDQHQMALFKEHCMENPLIHKELILHQQIMEALSDADTMKLRDSLDEVYKKYIAGNLPRERKHIHISRLFKKVSIAASILIFVTSMYLAYHKRTMSNERIFKKYYQRYDASFIFRSIDDSLRQITDGIQKYKEGEYETALNIFTEYKSNIMAKYYAGIIYMELNDYENALSSFLTVIENRNNLFIEQAEWYYGLTCLKTGNDERAEKMFTKIAGSDKSFYREKAIEVLSLMNKN